MSLCVVWGGVIGGVWLCCFGCGLLRWYWVEEGAVLGVGWMLGLGGGEVGFVGEIGRREGGVFLGMDIAWKRNAGLLDWAELLLSEYASFG